MAFNRSLVQRLRYRPWRYTTPPTYNPDGSEATPGIKQELDGVFILLSQELVDILKEGLTAAEKTELQGYVLARTEAQCAEWHVPVWAGETNAIYIRVPATVWDDPTSAPPQKVKTYFQNLWSEVN